MVTFMDKTTDGRRYLHNQPSENGVDGEETKLPIHSSITSLCKFDCVGGPPSLPWWSEKNLEKAKHSCCLVILRSKRISLLTNCGITTWSPGLSRGLGYQYMRSLLSNHFIRSVCEYWCPKTNALHTSKGKMSLSIFDIYSFLGLPLSSKYHVSKKSDMGNRTPHPGIPSSIINAGAYEWGDCQLCTFILPARDIGCICPGTFDVSSFMASGIGYCLLMTILMSIYKGLNEISRSLHPGRGRGHFSAYFLYAWLAKNFDIYKLDGEPSSNPCMVKFSGLDQAKSFWLKEARGPLGS
ncbi:hypothetical protein Cgig2_034132 [Carnegiea gigantea]|uniref:Aminotransferase-like plant mobile domain-containing protein n=1 Tax=Carnegiea gigantea TaxID=171969 RepID=A0A9Q1KFG6_9CARY|nr:hypothetical protein Cgig2_034132 [Carnegiea gigantea]